MFYKCYKLSSVVIPEGIESIGAGNFSFSVLESVTIPSTVKTIVSDAFWSISTLKEVHIKAVTPPWNISNNAFGKSRENCTLFVPVGSLDAYKNANIWKEFAEIKEE